ncbi:uncharacterized protein [Dermacentor albipictus]|uniref:uncharacterized protein n=1 Tax=Dermacentor albipictus TaxID=60249 RepID=UPI0038FC3C0A
MISPVLPFVLVSLAALSPPLAQSLEMSSLSTRRQPGSPHNVVIGDDHHSRQRAVAVATDRPAESSGVDLLHGFFRANQVVIYIACSCFLMGFVLVFTLVTVYGGRRRSNSSRPESSASWAQFAESYPLLDFGQSSQALTLQGNSDEDDENERNERVVSINNEKEVDRSTTAQSQLGRLGSNSVDYAPSEISEGQWSTTWSLPGDPPQVIIKSKPFVKRPIEVFPRRLLDLCNQDAPLTFFALLPHGRQHRHKWLAHTRHSEVFQLSSVLRRTVLKVVPVTGDFTEQQVGTITSAIQCCFKLSTLKHGTVYRAPNFIEVERIVCVFDQFPEWLLHSGGWELDSSSESLADSLASEMAGTDGNSDASDLLVGFRGSQGINQCCLTRHFIVFELCYAGKPLSRISLRSAVQGRSLVQQAACCMAVAESALGFRHTSVDADKLLVSVTDAGCLEYRLPDRTPLSVDSAGLKAHLAGCLSFTIDLGGDRKDEDSAFQGNATDSPALNCSGDGPPRFYGNVMWLVAVMDSVVNKLRSEVPGSRALAERAVFEELLSWQARLQQCNSADEFVATLGL